MKVGFFFENIGLEKIDFSNPNSGNPGCGGTQYAMITCAFNLQVRGIKVKLYTLVDGIFPKNLEVSKVENFYEALRDSKRERLILIYKPLVSGVDWILRENANLEGTKLVQWLHVTPSQSFLRKIAKIPEVRAVVALGHNQFTRLKDNPISEKVVLIPPHVTLGRRVERPYNSRNLEQIVFVGALVPAKGVHILLDQWSKIRKRIPNAKLIVIGSGNLYNSNLRMGPRGIAENSYEERMFRNLINDGSVEFVGKVDSSTRDQLIAGSAVGIVNPSAETEVFCVSAIEMQLLGTPIVALKRYGLRDILIHKETGLHYMFRRNLWKHVVKLINDVKLNEKLSKNGKGIYLKKVGNPTTRWVELLIAINNNQKIPTKFESDVAGMQYRVATWNSVLVNRMEPYWPTLVELYWRCRMIVSRIIKLLWGY
jgi:glycosyltransferase involved in cell wall biosynthesis